MKNLFLAIGAVLAIVLSGCREKTDANSQLEKVARELATAPAAQPTAAAPQSTPANTTAPATPPPAAPAQEVNQAMVAYKAGQLEDAVTRLHRLRSTAVMTPQQHIDLNNAMGAVMTEIYALAAKGDSKAQQAVKQYEKMQTGGR